MTTLICDSETDGMLPQMTRLWTLQIGDADGDDNVIYADQPGYPSLAEGAARIKAADLTVWHNGFGFDLWAVERFFPGTVDPTKVFDTLVAWRLLDPGADTHTLKAMGEKLGVAKGEYKGDFQSFTPELVAYARQDIETGRAGYRWLRASLEGWGSSVETEMRFAWIMALQERNGFHLDVPAAMRLDVEFRADLAVEEAALKGVFPPRWVPERKGGSPAVFTPKADSKRHGYIAGAPLVKVSLQEFNPGSRQQVAGRLQALGWKPKRFGGDGTPTVDDDVLSSLPWPEARRLVKYYTIKKKLEQISDGKSAWMKWVQPDSTVHGRVNTVGCAPGRCSHSKPNMAQVNKKDPRMRGCWVPRAGWVLVGIDGEGLQARALAHYLARYDGGSYARKITEGNKKLRTDEHSSNLQELPFLKAAFDAAPELFSKARDGAKACLYCALFGGQDPELGRTLKEACVNAALPIPKVPDRELGALARKALFRAINGFEALYQAIQATISGLGPLKGHLRGLDGRHIRVRSKHSALVFLMQGAEAAVMKLAAVLFHYTRAPEAGLQFGRDFAYVAHVHDEAQLECRPDVAELVGRTYAECIAEAGRLLGMRCPLLGAASKPGKSWAETH